jgi:pyrimidine oxygenase
VAKLLDEAASIPGTKGIMLTFDDFLVGIDEFAEKVQPLMTCRQDALVDA